MKNVATTKTGVTYFVFDRDEEQGVAWGRSIVDGKIKGASRRLKLDNLTFTGTATRDNDGVVTYVTAPKPLAFAMEMPALSGDVVTQGHADYCADNGHAKHTVDGVVSPWCPRCGGSTRNPAPNAEARAAALADAEAPATLAAPAMADPVAEPVFEVTSEARDQVPMSDRVAAALPYLHTELVDDPATKFNVHLRAAGEGLGAFWTDSRGNSWRIEFPDEDRNLTGLVVFEWQTKLDGNGRPLRDEDGEPTGAGRWHTAHTSTVQAKRVIENLGL